MFSPVAMTIIFALAASLVLSLTVIPVIAYFLIKDEPEQDPWLVRKLSSLYAPALKKAIQHPNKLLMCAGGLLMLTVVVYMFIGKTFMPVMDEGDIIIGVEKLPSITLQQSVATDLSVQKNILSQVSEVKAMYSRVGSDELGLDPMGLNQTDDF